jgi:hypothetical protein
MGNRPEPIPSYLEEPETVGLQDFYETFGSGA